MGIDTIGLATLFFLLFSFFLLSFSASIFFPFLAWIEKEAPALSSPRDPRGPCWSTWLAHLNGKTACGADRSNLLVKLLPNPTLEAISFILWSNIEPDNLLPGVCCYRLSQPQESRRARLTLTILSTDQTQNVILDPFGRPPGP